MKKRTWKPSGWQWMSFASEEEGFLGVCIVKAADIGEAVKVSYRLGINPGGEVQASEMSEHTLPGPAYRERLLTRAEIRVLDEEQDAMFARLDANET